MLVLNNVYRNKDEKIERANLSNSKHTGSNWKIIFVLNSPFTDEGYRLYFFPKSKRVNPSGTASVLQIDFILKILCIHRTVFQLRKIQNIVVITTR